jgi:hypothetical protein
MGMTPDQRFAVLIVLLTAALAAIGWLAKSLLSATAQWGRTGAKIEELANDIRDLVDSKVRDHARMDNRMDRLEGRVERHEVWHQDH